MFVLFFEYCGFTSPPKHRTNRLGLFLQQLTNSSKNKTGLYAFVVLMESLSNLDEYESAQKSLACYCESREIPYYLIVNDEENVKGCAMEDYMHQRHCILANFMNTTEHEWFVMLDADMGIINPNQKIDEFIPTNPSTFLVLTNRVMNSEIMAGSYIVRNDPRGRDFLMMWAKSETEYGGRYGRDNAAIHSGIIRNYFPELEANLTKCEYWWELAKRDCWLYLYEVCVRDLLDNRNIPGIKFLRKSYSYVRDGWLTEGKFSRNDFIFHNWKESQRSRPGEFGWWDYQFTNEAFHNLSHCALRKEAELWRYRPGFEIDEKEIRKWLDTWVIKTKNEEILEKRFSRRFDVEKVPDCHWTKTGLVFDEETEEI
ncbi:unnamed protein product, partial [Mesorhabditis belari]|uniref:Uncharacterized protein n=1 Tax=Mesorhabditis belari TaxID=2138241 RepID=A0AAF3FIY6_9BILA